MTVVDPLPPGLTLVVASGGATTNTQGQVVWPNLGTLAASNGLTLTMTVQVGPNVSGGLTNLAVVSSPTPDPVPNNNTNPPTITQVTPEADLALTKTAQTNVVAGADFNYTLTVTNYGPSAATNVSVVDPLPPGLTLVVASGGGSTNTQGQVVWPSLGTLAASNGLTLTMTVQVNGSVTGITNLAVVSSPTPDPVPNNNTNPPTITTVTPQADLALAKTAQPTVLAGANFNYTLTVTNYGPSAATNITVLDYLPPGLSVTGISNGGVTNTLSQVLWTGLGNLPANSGLSLTLTVLAGGNVAGFTNVAVVGSPTPDPVPGNNTNPPVVTVLTPVADVAVNLAGPGSVQAGSNFTYTVTITNAGPSAAAAVVVTDALPVNVTFISTTA